MLLIVCIKLHNGIIFDQKTAGIYQGIYENRVKNNKKNLKENIPLFYLPNNEIKDQRAIISKVFLF